MVCINKFSQLQNSYFFAVIDASGKFPSGILGGNFHEPGDLFQCLGIDAQVDSYNIKGKYCTVTFSSGLGFNDLLTWSEFNITWPPELISPGGQLNIVPDENVIDEKRTLERLKYDAGR